MMMSVKWFSASTTPRPVSAKAVVPDVAAASADGPKPALRSTPAMTQVVTTTSLSLIVSNDGTTNDLDAAS